MALGKMTHRLLALNMMTFSLTIKNVTLPLGHSAKNATLSKMTLSKITILLMTLSKITILLMTLSIMTLGIKM